MATPTTLPTSTLSSSRQARIGFIGAGRVARILVDGWATAGASPHSMTAFDPDPEALERLTSSRPAITPGTLELAAAADIVFVGVHPPVAAEVFAGLKGLLEPHALLVSLVPATRLDRIAGLVGADRAVARVIPNAPSIARAGFNPLSFNALATAEDRVALTSLLAPLGAAPVVDDSDLEAYAVLTAMGPTYLWPQFYALMDVAAGMGLGDDAAAKALEAMATGALTTMRASGLDRESVLDLIPSKPLALQVSTMSAAYSEVLLPLHARLSGAAPV